MHQIAVTLLLALLSLAFAPAPFPKVCRETEQPRLVRQYDARLRELGVRWQLHQEWRRQSVSVEIREGETVSLIGRYEVLEGGLADTLEAILFDVQQRIYRPK